MTEYQIYKNNNKLYFILKIALCLHPKNKKIK